MRRLSHGAVSCFATARTANTALGNRGLSKNRLYEGYILHGLRTLAIILKRNQILLLQVLVTITMLL